MEESSRHLSPAGPAHLPAALSLWVPCSWTNAETDHPSPNLTVPFPVWHADPHSHLAHHHPTFKHVSATRARGSQAACRHWGTHESQETSAATTLYIAERPSEQIKAGGPRSHADRCLVQVRREGESQLPLQDAGLTVSETAESPTHCKSAHLPLHVAQKNSGKRICKGQRKSS